MTNKENSDPRYEALRGLEREALETKQKLMLVRGKIIVAAIAVFIGICSVVNIFVSLADFNGAALLGSLVNIFCVIALIKRAAWARYFFIAVLIFSSIVTFVWLGRISPNLSYSDVQVKYDSATGQFYGIPQIPLFQDEPVTPRYIILSVLLAVYLVCAALLAFSKSVKLSFSQRTS
jgi:hypothetical protein